MEQLSIFNIIEGHSFVNIPVTHELIVRGLTRLKGDKESFYLDDHYLVRFYTRKIYDSITNKPAIESFEADVFKLMDNGKIDSYTSELEHMDVIWTLKHEAESYQKKHHLETLPYPLDNPDWYFKWREELIRREAKWEAERKQRLREWKLRNHIA